jgi:hypothetical protein
MGHPMAMVSEYTPQLINVQGLGSCSKFYKKNQESKIKSKSTLCNSDLSPAVLYLLARQR